MATDVTNYKCPACMAPIHYVGEAGKLVCEYCDSTFSVEEVEAMMAEKEKNAEESFEVTEKRREKEAGTEWGVEEGMKAFSCPSCGAELICDETTVATSCPYCDNPTVVPGQVGGVLKPDYILPFRLNQEQAKEALKNYYKGKKFLPNSFTDDNKVEEIKGVYVPFWLFDGKTNVAAQFEATKSHTRRQGDLEITETEHYDVRRVGNFEFTKVPVDASTKMPDAHMDAIEPYDYNDLKPYSNVYLPGFLADKYDLEPEECAGRAEERVKNTAINLIKSEVKGYDTVIMKNNTVNTTNTKESYALLPTYLLSTKWNDENYLFAMNGQTGKLIGDLPIDKKKYWTWFIGIFVVAWLLLGSLLAFAVCEKVLTGYGIGLLLGLASAFLVCSSFKAAMQTAKKATTAGNYVTKKGLTLTFHTDKYTHTTRTERRIETEKKS